MAEEIKKPGAKAEQEQIKKAVGTPETGKPGEEKKEGVGEAPAVGAGELPEMPPFPGKADVGTGTIEAGGVGGEAGSMGYEGMQPSMTAQGGSEQQGKQNQQQEQQNQQQGQQPQVASQQAQGAPEQGEQYYQAPSTQQPAGQQGQDQGQYVGGGYQAATYQEGGAEGGYAGTEGGYAAGGGGAEGGYAGTEGYAAGGAGGYDQYQPYQETMSSDVITEISEQVVTEKLASIVDKIEKVISFKTTAEAKISSLNERLKRIEQIIDRMQISIMQKVGEYVGDVKDIKREMIETQKSFKKLSGGRVSSVRKSEGVEKVKRARRGPGMIP